MHYRLISLSLSLVLIACTPPPEISNVTDCGDGTYSISGKDQDYSTVRDCLLETWELCSESLGSLTTFNEDGEQTVYTYHVATTDDECEVRITQDRENLVANSNTVSQKVCLELAPETGDAIARLTESNCTPL